MQSQSQKIISIMRSGHHIEMHWGLQEEVRIRLRPVEDGEPLAEYEHCEFVEERFRGGERIVYKEAHTPSIAKLARNREWTVVKQD